MRSLLSFQAIMIGKDFYVLFVFFPTAIVVHRLLGQVVDPASVLEVSLLHGRKDPSPVAQLRPAHARTVPRKSENKLKKCFNAFFLRSNL